MKRRTVERARGWLLGVVSLQIASGAAAETPKQTDFERVWVQREGEEAEIVRATAGRVELLAVENGLADGSAGMAQAVGRALPKTSTVVPILLIPEGSTVTRKQLLTLRQALDNVRLWYQRELPERDVRWSPLQVLRGARTAAGYLEDNRVWFEVPDEIRAAFGWSPWDVGETHHIALVIGRNLLGWAGGAGFPDGRGLAILGLESLVDLGACAPEWWCTQEVWHGTAIHELGHCFTLPHDENPASIMQFHGGYKQKHFVPEHQAIVQASPAATAKRPLPAAVWSFDAPCNDGGVLDESSGSRNLGLSEGVRCVPGLIEGAADFDGVDGLAVTNGSGPAISDALTVSAWVRPGKVVGIQTIVNQWYALDSFALTLEDGAYTFAVAFPDGRWGRVVRVSSADAVAGRWAHVAGVYSGSELRLYIDGKLRAKAVTSGRIQQSDRPVAVGNHPSWNAFDGLVDQVRIYAAALERDEIFPY